MTLEISGHQVQTILLALEDRKSNLATRALLVPGHYPMQEKMADELRNLDDIIETLKTTIREPWTLPSKT